MSIAVFYHVFQSQGWEMLYQNQIHRLYASGLLKHSDHLHIGVAGSAPLPYIPKRANIKHHKDCSSEGPTLLDIHNYALSTKPAQKILYIHTKGVSKGSLQVDAWRLYMEYFLIDKWAECTILLDSHPCVGAQLRSKHLWPHSGDVPLHYSGNMWWATAEHIAQLSPSYLSNRGNCEFWLCSSFSPKADSPYCVHSLPEETNMYAQIVQPKHYMI